VTAGRSIVRNLEQPKSKPSDERTLTLLRDAASFRDLIAQRRVRLGGRATSVAEFLADNPMEAAFGSAPGVARLCAVSPPTVLRLAQTLGFENYSALREVFRRPLRVASDERRPQSAPGPRCDEAARRGRAT